jgi:hypothetical protein
MENINKILLEIAHNSILDSLDNTNKLDREYYIKKYPQLLEKRATFVTLNKNKSLRGCIGSLTPYQSLIDDIINNSKAAAFEDPRFPKLNKNEFKNINIEISILTIPKRLDYTDIDDLKSKINVNIDGVVLKYLNHRATFLPQVWEQLPTFELFFKYLCNKAQLNVNCLENHPSIEVYQVEKIVKTQ